MTTTQQPDDVAQRHVDQARESIAEMMTFTPEAIAGPIVAALWRLNTWSEGIWALEYLDRDAIGEARRVLGILDDAAHLVGAAVGGCIPHTNPRRRQLVDAARAIVYAVAEADEFAQSVNSSRVSELAEEYGYRDLPKAADR